MCTSDDYKNYVQLFNRGAMLKPHPCRLTVIYHQATVHKKTLVIMAVMQSFALRPRADFDISILSDSNGILICLSSWHQTLHYKL